MKKTKPTYYRKKTASLPEKKIKSIIKVYKNSVKPALKQRNISQHAFSLTTLFLIVLFIFATVQGVFMYVNNIDFEKKFNKAENDLAYWENAILEHPKIPDVYYNASIYAAMLGDNDKALRFLEEATVLDPDFKEANELKLKISKK